MTLTNVSSVITRVGYINHSPVYKNQLQFELCNFSRLDTYSQSTVSRPCELATITHCKCTIFL